MNRVIARRFLFILEQRAKASALGSDSVFRRLTLFPWLRSGGPALGAGPRGAPLPHVCLRVPVVRFRWPLVGVSPLRFLSLPLQLTFRITGVCRGLQPLNPWSSETWKLLSLQQSLDCPAGRLAIWSLRIRAYEMAHISRSRFPRVWFKGALEPRSADCVPQTKSGPPPLFL